MSSVVSEQGVPAATGAAHRYRLPRAIPAAIAGVWIIAVAAQVTGKSALLHGMVPSQAASAPTTSAARGLPGWFLFGCTWGSHGLVGTAGGHGISPWLAVVVFLVAWQAMIFAMMLPSSLPLVRMFAATSRSHERPAWEMAAFLGGYVVVWSAFGAAAFAGDAIVHHMVAGSPWLGARPWVIAGVVLVIAGAFQFSSLKERCLNECRHPGAYLLRFYRGDGAAGAFRLGRGHGLFCVGCCWALMLIGVVAGMADLWWMVGLTALMYVEKTRPSGDRWAPVAGVTLLALGVVVIAHPTWLPTALGAG